jgi:hypothetical protein
MLENAHETVRNGHGTFRNGNGTVRNGQKRSETVRNGQERWMLNGQERLGTLKFFFYPNAQWSRNR